MNTTQHAVSTTPSSSVLSNLKKKPKVRDWLDLSPTGELQIHTGKVEIGQGILHALMRIACDELGLSPSGVKALAANTTRSPDEAVTSGSLSVQDSGATVRHVCAYVREACLQVYAQQRCVAKEAVLIKDGQLKARTAPNSSPSSPMPSWMRRSPFKPCPQSQRMTIPMSSFSIRVQRSRKDKTLPKKSWGSLNTSKTWSSPRCPGAWCCTPEHSRGN